MYVLTKDIAVIRLPTIFHSVKIYYGNLPQKAKEGRKRGEAKSGQEEEKQWDEEDEVEI